MKKALTYGMMVLLYACASPVKTEYDPQVDFSQYETFSWVTPDIPVVKDPIIDSQLLARRLETAVINALKHRGYIQTTEAPDMQVTYHIAHKSVLRSSPFSLGLGYGHFNGPWGHSVFLDTDEIESYEKGILIIDILDARTNKLIWRGWDSQVLNQENFSQPALRNSVEKILERFPPGADKQKRSSYQ